MTTSTSRVRRPLADSQTVPLVAAALHQPQDGGGEPAIHPSRGGSGAESGSRIATGMRPSRRINGVAVGGLA